MFHNLSKTIESISQISVSEERKEVLQSLIDYIQNKVNLQEEIRLNFICTHNSRRSHLSQIWAQTMAFQFGINNVFCYSGGTEATAMFPKVGETLVNLNKTCSSVGPKGITILPPTFSCLSNSVGKTEAPHVTIILSKGAKVGSPAKPSPKL